MASSARRRHRLRWAVASAVAIAVGSAGGLAAARYATPLPAPQLQLTLPLAASIAAAPPIPLPLTGSFAITDSQSGPGRALNPQAQRPTASIAKTMTALVVLSLHPLDPGADGPTLVVSATDVAVLHQVIAENGSHVAVEVGERLTERDLLLGMMLPSANNFAIMLGRWVDGSDAAFVTRLNAAAATMGMARTHFDDADGVSPATVSTASDLLILGAAAIANPALAEVMSHATATLPDGQVIQNLDTMVGTSPGWLGVKTGHTDAGGYCLLFAVRRSLSAGPPITVVGVVLGQSTRVQTFADAQAAVDADIAAYTVLTPDDLRPTVGGLLKSPWGALAGTATEPSGAAPLVVWRGVTPVLTLAVGALSADIKKGDHVADVTALINGHIVAVWPVVATGDLAGPPWWWRLRR